MRVNTVPWLHMNWEREGGGREGGREREVGERREGGRGREGERVEEGGRGRERERERVWREGECVERGRERGREGETKKEKRALGTHQIWLKIANNCTKQLLRKSFKVISNNTHSELQDTPELLKQDTSLTKKEDTFSDPLASILLEGFHCIYTTHIPVSIKVVNQFSHGKRTRYSPSLELAEVRVQQLVTRLRPPRDVYDEISTFITQLTRTARHTVWVRLLRDYWGILREY